MIIRLRTVVPLIYIVLLVISCSATESSIDQDAIEEDGASQGEPEDIGEENDLDVNVDSGDIKDIDTEEVSPGLQNVSVQPLEGLVLTSWDLPPDDTLTHIRITGSPAELMWGEAERIIEPTATSYLFDDLVNDIQYSFEIQAFAGDEEVGGSLVFHTTPYSRPLLSLVSQSSHYIFDSVSKQPALGWDSLADYVVNAYNWSPDRTKVVVSIFDSVGKVRRCALLDRVTRKELYLEYSDEFSGFCMFGFSWSPDSRRLAFRSLQSDGRPTHTVLNVQTGEIERDWPSFAGLYTAALDWSPDGGRFALAVDSGDIPERLTIIDSRTKEIESDWPDLFDHGVTSQISNMQWSPDSKWLAMHHTLSEVSGFSNYYIIINAESKTIETGWPETIFDGITNLYWSPDGEILILLSSRSQGGGMQVINTSTKENIPGWPMDWPSTSIQDIAWSHDSQRIATAGSTSPYLVVFDRNSKEIEEGWAPLDAQARGVAWSPQHDPPSAPAQVELHRADTEATLSWDSPDDATILDYRITIEPADQLDGPADYLLDDAAATEHRIEGLNPDVEYSVTVRAISVFGVGEPAISSIP